MKKNLFTLVSISLIVLSGCDKIVQKSSLYKTTKSQERSSQDDEEVLLLLLLFYQGLPAFCEC